MRDLSEALVLAGVNVIVVFGCIVIWATMMGMVQW